MSKIQPRPEFYQSACDRQNGKKASNSGKSSIIGPTPPVGTNLQPGAFSANSSAEIAAIRQQRAPQVVPPNPVVGEKASPIMKHRLKNCLAFWSTFCQSTLVLSWIANGFGLKWLPETGAPASAYFPNHKTATDNADFVTTSILSLVSAGSMTMVPIKPFLVSPLGVVFKKSNGKPRLFCDLRYLNKHINCPSFKYEDLSFCSQVIQPHDFMVTTDYHSGYHHVDLNENFWQYFGVEWQGNYYVYTSLPFGLSVACWAFTKITRELLHKWRAMGHRNCGYLDDGIHFDASETALADFVQSHLLPDTEKAGFILNIAKSHLQPAPQQSFLGVFVDSIRGCYEIPPEKQAIIVSLIQQALNSRHSCPIRLLERITGNIASMHWAFGPLSRLMTMSIYADMNTAINRWASVSLSSTSVHDLNFWLCGFDVFNGFKPLWEPVGFHTTIYTDAAGLNLKNYGGWAGWTLDPESHTRLIAKGIWTGDLIVDHSTTQELWAVFNTIQSFNSGRALSGKRVLVKTDNQAVFFIINKAGSRDNHVHDLCKRLLWYCIQEGITLVAEWIPRDLNVFADFYSKLTDSGDWKLDPVVFAGLNKLWGPLEIDLFASFENHQLDRYYSRYFTPTCEGVNAFDYHWGRSCWCNPPFSQIGKVLSKGLQDGARMVFLCPFTPTAPWWPLLTSNGKEFLWFVHAHRIIYKRPNLFLPGHMAHAYANKLPRWDSIAFLLDFSFRSPSIKRIPPY